MMMYQNHDLVIVMFNKAALETKVMAARSLAFAMAADGPQLEGQPHSSPIGDWWPQLIPWGASVDYKYLASSGCSEFF